MNAFLEKVVRRLDTNVFCRFLPFEVYRRIHSIFGYPIIQARMRHYLGYSPDLKAPETFSERVADRFLKENNSIYLKIVDKIEVREYIADRLGAEYLIPVIGVLTTANDLKLKHLAEPCAIKLVHASGRNIFAQKGHQQIDEIREQLATWQSELYGFQELVWFVQKIPRRILIEKMLIDEHGNVPKDYKFFVFGGKVHMIQVDSDRFGDHRRNFYDPVWNKMDLQLTYKNGEFDERPQNLEKMVEIAESLGKEFDFMRVDLYSHGSKVYFGELTPCPGLGREKFIPGEFDTKLGALWSESAPVLKSV